MMDDLGIDQFVNVLGSALATLACVLFAAMYHLRARWWQSAVGRNLMGFAGAVGVLCLYTVLITIWPEGCAAAVLRGVRTGVLLGIAALMVQRTGLLMRAQRHPKGEDDR